MKSLSSNHFSHEDQVRDVVRWLMANDETAYNDLKEEFVSIDEWTESAFKAFDVEYGSWVTDWIETNTDIIWWEGEPAIFDHGNAMVCVDCYFAHHYGKHEHDGKWYAGESDTPADKEPLGLLSEYELSDNTDSETGEGIDNFSREQCQGCGSVLGGFRFRLHWTEGGES